VGSDVILNRIKRSRQSIRPSCEWQSKLHMPNELDGLIDMDEDTPATDIETPDINDDETADDQGEGQDAPAVEAEGDDQPTTEMNLVELPDGRKVTPETAVEEYKKLQADYTRKTQRISELEKQNSTDDAKAWEKEGYEPKDWGEVMENATQEAIRRIESKGFEKTESERVANEQLESEIAGIRQYDKDFDSDAVLKFANKRTEDLGIKYPSFTVAYKDYKSLEKHEKLVEKRIATNKQKRVDDPTSISSGSGGGKIVNDAGGNLYERAQAALKSLG